LGARTGKRWLARTRSLTVQQGRPCGTHAEQGPGCTRRAAAVSRQRASTARRAPARLPGPLAGPGASSQRAGSHDRPMTGPAPRAGSARCWRTCTPPSSACCACSWSRSGPTRRAAQWAAQPAPARAPPVAAGARRRRRWARRRWAPAPLGAAGRLTAASPSGLSGEQAAPACPAFRF